MFHTKPRYTVADCLSLLSMSRARFYEAIHAGKIETYRIGRRRYVNPKALDEYVELCEKEYAAVNCG